MAKKFHEHQALVQAFLAEKEAEDPERYAEVCEKYPVLTPRQWRTVREKEVSFSDLTRRDGARYGEDGDQDDWDND